jgi:hypothetical protein
VDRRADDAILLTGPRPLVPGHLLAPFGWTALPLAAIIQSQPGLLKDLFELDQPRMHVIGLALAHLNHHQVIAIAPTLFRAPVREAVERILGRCPVGTARVLRRLPPRLLGVDGYKSLVELLDDPRSAKLLYHIDESKLTDPALRVLIDLPAALRPTLAGNAPFILLLDGLPAGLRWLAARTGAASFDALVTDLAAQAQPAQLVARMNTLISELPLPASLPPSTVDKATRIDATKAIRALAKQFKNCLASYTEQIDAGTSAIYLWEEPTLRAVCHVARHGRLRWALDDALGPRNAALSGEDRQRITDAFSQSGIPESRLFHALESVTQARAAKTARRLPHHERERQEQIW